MYKVAILGCENSHADAFLKVVLEEKQFPDIEFVGVYSNDREAARKLNEQFGVPVMDTPDALVGKVDGVMITARHGDDHYRYAKPYLESGIPMFVDKPITCTEADAAAFAADLKANAVRVCGGSVTTHTAHINNLAQIVAQKPHGKILGGFLRAPVKMKNEYGDFFFYAPHLVHMLTKIFGCFPKSVQAFSNHPTYNCVVRYEDYDVNLCFVDDMYLYYAGVNCAEAYVGDSFTNAGYFGSEIASFYDLLTGKPMEQSYEEFFSSVYILNALNTSIQTGTEVAVNRN